MALQTSLRRSLQGLALAGLIALPGAAPAQPAATGRPPSGHVVTQPDWLRRPAAEDMERFYPAGAADQGVTGAATITCEVTAAGTLTLCSVETETPPNYGFGAAALGLAHGFRMRPMTVDGHSVAGGKIRIPIRFELPKRRAPVDDSLRIDPFLMATSLTALFGLAVALAALPEVVRRARSARTPSALVEDTRGPRWSWIMIAVGALMLAGATVGAGLRLRALSAPDVLAYLRPLPIGAMALAVPLSALVRGVLILRLRLLYRRQADAATPSPPPATLSYHLVWLGGAAETGDRATQVLAVALRVFNVAFFVAAPLWIGLNALSR